MVIVKNIKKVYLRDFVFLIQTYSICDAKYYDASSNDNVSKYSGSGLSVTYDSSNQAYNIKNTVSGEKTIAIPNLNLLPSKASIDFNVKSAGTLNKQIGINLGTSALARLVRANTANYIQVSDGTNSNSSNYTVSDNTWYTLESTYDGTTITAKLIQNETVVATVSLDGSISANQVYLFKAYTLNTGNDVLVRNIKVL